MKKSINTVIIEDYRIKNKLTKKTFCELCQISVATYNRILKCENVHLIAIFKIAKVLNVQIHKLF